MTLLNPEENIRFTFFNGKYIFSLDIDWIIDGWDGRPTFFNVNQNWDIEKFGKKIKINFNTKEKQVSFEEINKEIKKVRKKYPELLV